MELRNPQEERSKRIKIVPSGRKRKAPTEKKKKSGGTETGHYVRFLDKCMDEVDLYPELKAHYIVMDNASIHIADRIDEMFTERGYRSILPSSLFSRAQPNREFLVHCQK